MPTPGGESAGRPAGTPASLITLTTDYGLQDPYVGILRSRVVLRAPQIPLIDLTHEVSAFRPEQAGYWLYCVHSQLPPGTVHLAVVDPGVGSPRAILVLCAAGQLFVAPDNGLLGLIAQRVPGSVAYRVEAAALAALGLSAQSATFHGRDIMAPLAAELAMRRVAPEALGPQQLPAPGTLQPPCLQSDDSLLGHVAVIDHFGNLLTTIAAQEMGARQCVRLVPGGPPFRRVRTYTEAPVGQCVALVNSAAMLEIAAREASAGAALNVHAGQPVYVSER